MLRLLLFFSANKQTNLCFFPEEKLEDFVLWFCFVNGSKSDDDPVSFRKICDEVVLVDLGVSEILPLD